MAAEAEFTLIDTDIRNDPGFVPARAAYAAKLKAVEVYVRRLDHVIDTYDSAEWTVAARARQASLYDALMTSGPSPDELARVTSLTVARYAWTVHLSRTLSAYHPGVDEAVRRLAALTRKLGNDRMRALTAQVDGFVYTDDMFLRAVPGLRAAPRAGELPMPLPMFVGR